MNLSQLDSYPRTQKVARYAVYLLTPELQVIGFVMMVMMTLAVTSNNSSMLAMDQVVFPSEVELEAMTYFGPDAMSPVRDTQAIAGGVPRLAASGARQ
jgi:hypothetical protein